MLRTNFSSTDLIKLYNSKVLVSGISGIGSIVLQHLTASGIGTIGIGDNNMVSETDLNQHTIFDLSDLGKLKTIALREKLNLRDPTLNFELINVGVTIENVNEIVANFDIIVDSSNDKSTHQLYIENCSKLNKTLIFAGIKNSIGYIGYMNNKDAIKENWLNSIFSDVAFSSDENNLIFNLFTGIIGGFQANEVLKHILLPNPAKFNKFYTIDFLNNKFYIIE
jgi:molybdopterin/thiamine biosynthesis adenylyltransferase